MPKNRPSSSVDRRGKDFLTEAEMRRFLEAARHGRHGARDYLLMLMTYRHGLRVSELVDVRLKDLDVDSRHWSALRPAQERQPLDASAARRG